MSRFVFKRPWLSAISLCSAQSTFVPALGLWVVFTKLPLGILHSLLVLHQTPSFTVIKCQGTCNSPLLSLLLTPDSSLAPGCLLSALSPERLPYLSPSSHPKWPLLPRHRASQELMEFQQHKGKCTRTNSQDRAPRAVCAWMHSFGREESR